MKIVSGTKLELISCNSKNVNFLLRHISSFVSSLTDGNAFFIVKSVTSFKTKMHTINGLYLSCGSEVIYWNLE